jgi:hypothetical protein
MPIVLPEIFRFEKSGLDTRQKRVSVSLAYWHSSSQCLSEWNAAELKKLRKAIDKVQSLTAVGVRTDPGLNFKQHFGPSKGSGFSRPPDMPKDFSLCEIRVGEKARLHGSLNGDSFYLVWLDRAHGVFPAGK